LIATAADIRGIGFTSQRTRDRMVERLEQNGIENPDVLSAFAHVPRHLFVDDMLQTRAYEDVSLPIGEGQTISRPWVVARMTEILLEEGPVSRVLEVGTGSGFQAAILSGLVDAVFSVERIRMLHERATARRWRAAGVPCGHASRRSVTDSDCPHPCRVYGTHRK